MTLSFPVAPMQATLGYAAHRGQRLGVRDQVGRLPDAGVRRPGPGAAAELEPDRRHGEVPGAAAARRRRSACSGSCSTASSSCSTSVGRPRFELIQRKQADSLEAAFFVFDVLAIDAHDTISLPYEDRRRLLRELMDDGTNWSVPAHRLGDGQGLLDATVAQELEGVMAKRLGTDVPAGRPVEGLAQGQEPPAGGRRHRRLHGRHRQPLDRRSGRCSSGGGSTACWRSPAASAPASTSVGWRS